MNNEENKCFDNLMRIKVLTEMIKFEEEVEGRVTRSCKQDSKRSMNLIRYGFENGIKFAKGKKDEVSE